MVNKALQLDDEVEGMLFTGRKTIHFPNPLEMRYLDGKHSGSQDRELPNNLLALGACDEDAFPNTHRLLVIACTLPITNAETERSFSVMK